MSSANAVVVKKVRQKNDVLKIFDRKVLHSNTQLTKSFCLRNFFVQLENGAMITFGDSNLEPLHFCR